MNTRNDLSRLETLVQIYEFVLDQLDEGVHVVDESGKTIIYNRKMAEIEAMSKDDVIDRDVMDVFVFPNDEQSTLLQALNDGRSTRNIKQSYFNVKGTEITTINHSVPIVVGDTTIGAVEIARDITKMEKIQESILKRTETRITFETVIGQSEGIREVLEDAKRATRTNSPVLIVGETGTGKEIIAQSIHNGSPRSNAPFIVQNCSVLSEEMFEGLLLGTMQGAFDGAVDKPGLMEMANGGTLMLEELNALSPGLQAKLLRLVQEKRVRRIGDTEDRRVDVRLISTIHEDPLDAVATGRLRKDLYYRLSTITLFLPPLRHRRDDIPHFTEVFIQKYNDLFRMNVKGVSSDVKKFFMSYDWPGNVRELEHTIEGAMNMVGDDHWVRLVHLPFQIRRKLYSRDETPLQQSVVDARIGLARPSKRLQGQIREYERSYIQKVLAKHAGNVTAAARELGMSRQSLQYRLRKLELQSK